MLGHSVGLGQGACGVGGTLAPQACPLAPRLHFCPLSPGPPGPRWRHPGPCPPTLHLNPRPSVTLRTVRTPWKPDPANPDPPRSCCSNGGLSPLDRLPPLTHVLGRLLIYPRRSRGPQETPPPPSPQRAQRRAARWKEYGKQMDENQVGRACWAGLGPQPRRQLCPVPASPHWVVLLKLQPPSCCSRPRGRGPARETQPAESGAPAASAAPTRPQEGGTYENKAGPAGLAGQVFIVPGPPAARLLLRLPPRGPPPPPHAAAP